MVSVKRPSPQNKTARSGSSGYYSCSPVKYMIFLFILYQSCTLLWKLKQKYSVVKDTTTVTGSFQARPLTDLLREKIEQTKEEKNQRAAVAVAVNPAKPLVLDKKDDNMPAAGVVVKNKMDENTGPDSMVLPPPKEQQQQRRDDAAAAAAGNEEHDENRIHEPGQQQQLHPRNDELAQDTITVLQKTGSGPTDYGYVVDMIQEREHAAFRQGELPFSASFVSELEKKVSALVGGATTTNIKACEYIHDDVQDNHKLLLQNAKCRDRTTPLVFYNSAPFPRLVCGKDQLLKPNEAIQLDEDHDCFSKTAGHPQISHFFPVETIPLTTNVNDNTVPPIVIHHTQPFENLSPERDLETVSCNVPCLWEKNIDTNKWDRYVAGTDWKIYQTHLDPAWYPDAKVERTFYRRDIYFATTSLESDIPFSFYDGNIHNLRNRPAIDYQKAQKKVTYLVNEDCVAPAIRRPKWVSAVQDVVPVEAYGKCSHNTELGPGETLDTLAGRIALSQKNCVHLAIEASTERYQITTHAFEALLSGAVPALAGPINMDKLLPKNSAIFNVNFKTYENFAAKVAEVVNNEDAWNAFQKWRTDEAAILAFERRFNFTKTSQECRMCKWAYAKKYGLHWNHRDQEIIPSHIPKRLCLAPETASSSNSAAAAAAGGRITSLVTRPFREEWVDATSTHTTDNSKEDCTSQSSESFLERQGHYSVRRTVIQHDGIVDIVLHEVEQTSTEHPIVLRLHMAIRNSEGAHFRDPHTQTPSIRTAIVSSAAIKDEHSKATVLANWETRVWSPSEGIVEIVIGSAGENNLKENHEDLVRRIRVILEDVDHLHDKMTEFFPSAYGKMMTKDFIDPVELFYVESTTT